MTNQTDPLSGDLLNLFPVEEQTMIALACARGWTFTALGPGGALRCPNHRHKVLLDPAAGVALTAADSFDKLFSETCWSDDE